MTIAARDWIFYTFFCGFYAWLKNKLFFFWTYYDFSYNYIKAILMTGSWAAAWALAYPFHYARELVDLWPKERGGHCTWNNSYNNAIRWMFENIDIMFTNFFPNYWKLMLRKGLPVLGMMWFFDNYGFFTNVMDPHLNLHTMFPASMESV